MQYRKKEQWLRNKMFMLVKDKTVSQVQTNIFDTINRAYFDP